MACRIFVFLYFFSMMLSCSNADKYTPLGLKPNDTIPLLDVEGGTPATLFLRGIPASQTSTPPDQIVGIPFDAVIDLGKSNPASSVIWNLADPTVSVLIIFIDADGREFVFTVNPPLPKNNLVRTTLTQPLPLALGTIARIVLKVYDREVAFHPPRK